MTAADPRLMDDPALDLRVVIGLDSPSCWKKLQDYFKDTFYESSWWCLLAGLTMMVADEVRSQKYATWDGVTPDILASGDLYYFSCPRFRR